MEQQHQPWHVSDKVLARKGASKAADIPEEVLELLHQGALESVNLTEWLAVDHVILLRHVLPEVGLHKLVQPLELKINQLKQNSTMKIIPFIAEAIRVELQECNPQDFTAAINFLSAHRSDSVRCWVTYMIGLNEELSLEEKLVQMKPFAADKHFGVREIGWMAVRESIIRDLPAAISLYRSWVTDSDANVRRFAIESTRPRGVWCKHIEQLKLEPELALPLLECVNSDPAKYVQDSVGNWLNDASKAKPDWVLQVCDDWLRASDTKETRRIVAKAKRTLAKQVQ
ncbi:DNA alkylation repair protein [Paenibacillus profundus]|uniref:DNA alkylation repair protein n=1 Tax=Paenibacillus profundus TaxID=1173085 RepID=A0ABS8YF01_9BACL|nr:DNA alkylation repair protein [Paenibacillus profundus]MCE5169043.1 DNA alkylation repair protein [Paenibacillus profundus]